MPHPANRSYLARNAFHAWRGLGIYVGILASSYVRPANYRTYYRSITPSQGIGGWGGGLAEYTVANEDLVHVLPDSIPRERSLLIPNSVRVELDGRIRSRRGSAH